MKNAFFLICAFLFVNTSYSQAGSLDSTFNGCGKVATPFQPAADEVGYAMAIQNDGKIILAGTTSVKVSGVGHSDFALARYNTSGSLDTSFDGDGKLITDLASPEDFARAIAIQNNGKILVAGYTKVNSNYDFAVVRYNVNGGLDNTFGVSGMITTDFSSGNDYGRSIRIQVDGKIVVAGSHDNMLALARYNPDGSLDLGLNGTGKVLTEIGAGASGTAMALQEDGKIVVVGTCLVPDTSGNLKDNFAVVRYRTDGILDSSFGLAGKQITDMGPSYNFANAVAIQNDKKILVAGESWGMNSSLPYSSFAVARYHPDGSLDSGFSGDGKIITPLNIYDEWEPANSIAVQNDGKILVGGYIQDDIGFSSFSVVRYTSTGSLDLSFDGDGKVSTGIPISVNNFVNICGNQGNSFYVSTHSFAIALYSTRIYLAGRVYTGTGLNDFALVAYRNEAILLSIDLLLVAGSQSSNGVFLHWQTTDEQNISHFNIERSGDGTHFSTIGSVAGTNSISSTTTYSFNDQQPLQETNFYRLKIVKVDGRFTYSKVAAVKINDHHDLLLFPNPVNDLLQVQVKGVKQQTTLQIIDASGRVLRGEKVSGNGRSSFSISTKDLPRGTYNLVLRGPEKIQIQKFVKQ